MLDMLHWENGRDSIVWPLGGSLGLAWHHSYFPLFSRNIGKWIPTLLKHISSGTLSLSFLLLAPGSAESWITSLVLILLHLLCGISLHSACKVEEQESRFSWIPEYSERSCLSGMFFLSCPSLSVKKLNRKLLKLGNQSIKFLNSPPYRSKLSSYSPYMFPWGSIRNGATIFFICGLSPIGNAAGSPFLHRPCYWRNRQ